MRRGLTLAEVLIVCSISSVLATVLLGCLLASSRVTQHGAARTRLQQDCRHLINRISSLALAAVSPDQLQDAVERPRVDSGVSSEFWFYAADDFFGNSVFDPRNPTHHFYRVYREVDRVMLQALQDDGHPLAGVAPRQLALKVDLLEFERPEAGLLSVHVTSSEVVRGASRSIPLRAELRTTLDMPSFFFQ
ncbi:prepilin-type N-terminal cleavage/methylation domain-containing protein [bacterium]|nr:prepilin-type N-terminal cleavage/methylation domain-containing protein [bacterium]